MTDLYKNKYRIASARLQHWDYGWNAPYFITICTKNREWYFGDVRNGEMILSDTGIIANSLWTQIPDHFPFVELDAFVVMPNHIHGILVIENVRRDAIDRVSDEGDAINRVFTDIVETTNGGITGLKNPMLYENISRVIRWFKGRATHDIRINLSCFDWQERFHDHIIRDHAEFDRIRNYILQNPSNWNKDKFYLKH